MHHGKIRLMNELVVISGKGGTGKTSVVAAFATLAVGQQGLEPTLPGPLVAVPVYDDLDLAVLLLEAPGEGEEVVGAEGTNGNVA